MYVGLSVLNVNLLKVYFISLGVRWHIDVSLNANRYELKASKLYVSAVFDCIAARLFLSEKWKDSWIYLPESTKVKRATWFSQNDISAWSSARFVPMRAHIHSLRSGCTQDSELCNGCLERI